MFSVVQGQRVSIVTGGIHTTRIWHPRQFPSIAPYLKPRGGKSSTGTRQVRTPNCRKVHGKKIPSKMQLQIALFFVTAGVVSCEELGVLTLMTAPEDTSSSCPSVPTIMDFDVRQYMGRWYEIERFPNPFQEGDCAKADYKLLPNGTISITNSQLIKGTLDVVYGSGTLGSNPLEGKIEVEFPFTEGIPSSDGGGTNYKVVATDYVTYAVIHTRSCYGPDFKIEFSWIVARQPTLSPQFLVQLKERLTKVNVDVSQYVPTLQGPPTCPNQQP